MKESYLERILREYREYIDALKAWRGEDLSTRKHLKVNKDVKGNRVVAIERVDPKSLGDYL